MNANDFLLNTNQTDGAKGADKAKGAKAERRLAWSRLGVEKGRRGEGAARRRGSVEKGQCGEGAENERRAKLTKWGGQREYI